ncbi:START domain-containing protein 10-like isoform X2 [Coccinella septempunctata]|uniref:START domain-containing protein 10-like isoform X2 n=1 Tax=Coccinella septempunctata TaxID=41139 RepID=UPI001D0879AE|nr:START domain-containing protein 10-like isoform X2 [Coccinella septempunctata]
MNYQNIISKCNEEDEMKIGEVKIAEDSDFLILKSLIDDHSNWKLAYEKANHTKVWTQQTENCNFKMVKIHTIFEHISANTMFDVLHDPDYRREWDEHMISSEEIGYLNPNNDVGYYALSCPTPVKNRDFVLQRSWLDMGNEKLMFNHSVEHKDFPPRKGFIRATSHLTGFVIRTMDNGCSFGYVTQTDPRGKLPPWLVDKITKKFAPKMITKLKKAAENYEQWKLNQKNPDFKPWVYPELTVEYKKRVQVEDCHLKCNQIISEEPEDD